MGCEGGNHKIDGASSKQEMWQIVLKCILTASDDERGARSFSAPLKPLADS